MKNEREVVEHALSTGRWRFLDFELEVSEGVLVPRAETELLAITAIGVARAAASAELCVVDMCTGSGNIACAIARHVPRTRVFASDLTEATVNVARRNAEKLAAGRVTVLQGDLFAPLAALGLEGEVDIIACNPPYISEARLGKDKAHLLEREPREAFDAGPYGLSIHQRVVREAPRFLKVGGKLLFEVGLGQERQVVKLLERAKAYGNIESHADPDGNPRVVTATRLEIS